MQDRKSEVILYGNSSHVMQSVNDRILSVRPPFVDLDRRMFDGLEPGCPSQSRRQVTQANRYVRHDLMPPIPPALPGEPSRRLPHIVMAERGELGERSALAEAAITGGCNGFAAACTAIVAAAVFCPASIGAWALFGAKWVGGLSALGQASHVKHSDDFVNFARDCGELLDHAETHGIDRTAVANYRKLLAAANWHTKLALLNDVFAALVRVFPDDACAPLREANEWAAARYWRVIRDNPPLAYIGAQR